MLQVNSLSKFYTKNWCPACNRRSSKYVSYKRWHQLHLEKFLFVNQVAHDDSLLAARANTIRRDTAAGNLFQLLKVPTGILGQLIEGLSLSDIFGPAVKVLVDRLGMVEVRLGHGHLIVAHAIHIVGYTDDNAKRLAVLQVELLSIC